VPLLFAPPIVIGCALTPGCRDLFTKLSKIVHADVVIQSLCPQLIRVGIVTGIANLVRQGSDGLFQSRGMGTKMGTGMRSGITKIHPLVCVIQIARVVALRDSRNEKNQYCCNALQGCRAGYLERLSSGRA
jgi:hypothetical protein